MILLMWMWRTSMRAEKSGEVGGEVDSDLAIHEQLAKRS